MKSVQQGWNAEDYAGNSSAQLEWAQELIAKLDLKGYESVLDIGCGDGKVSAQLARTVRDGYVVGIDVSEDMIRHATVQFPSEAYPNLSFHCMDATDIRFADRFDVVFSNAALHWIENQHAVLKGVRSCLKPGGKLLFQMGGHGNAEEILNVVEKVVQQDRWQEYFETFTSPYHFCGTKEYEIWLAENGFCISRLELIPKDMKHKNADDFAGWLRTVWFPYTDCLPEEMRDKFLRNVVEIYTAKHPVDDLGNTHVRMVRLEVEAHAPEK